VRVECLSNTGLELCEVHEWPFRKSDNCDFILFWFDTYSSHIIQIFIRHVFLMDSEAERDIWAADVKKFTDLYLAQYEKDKQSTSSTAAVQRKNTTRAPSFLSFLMANINFC